MGDGISEAHGSRDRGCPHSSTYPCGTCTLNDRDAQIVRLQAEVERLKNDRTLRAVSGAQDIGLRGRAVAKLWAAFVAYQEWQKDDGDPETFADFAREEIPNLMPVDGG